MSKLNTKKKTKKSKNSVKQVNQPDKQEMSKAVEYYIERLKNEQKN